MENNIVENLLDLEYSDSGKGHFQIGSNNKNQDALKMNYYEVTKEDLTDLKKEMSEGFLSIKAKLDIIQGQYTELVVKQVELRKDIESLQIKVSSFDSIIKAIIGTIITAFITAVLALILK